MEPGLIRTNFESRVDESLETATPAHVEDTAYADLLAASDKNTTGGYANDFMATSPEAVAAVILRAVESARPRWSRAWPPAR